MQAFHLSVACPRGALRNSHNRTGHGGDCGGYSIRTFSLKVAIIEVHSAQTITTDPPWCIIDIQLRRGVNFLCLPSLDNLRNLTFVSEQLRNRLCSFRAAVGDDLNAESEGHAFAYIGLTEDTLGCWFESACALPSVLLSSPSRQAKKKKKTSCHHKRIRTNPGHTAEAKRTRSNRRMSEGKSQESNKCSHRARC